MLSNLIEGSNRLILFKVNKIKVSKLRPVPLKVLSISITGLPSDVKTILSFELVKPFSISKIRLPTLAS